MSINFHVKTGLLLQLERGNLRHQFFNDFVAASYLCFLLFHLPNLHRSKSITLCQIFRRLQQLAAGEFVTQGHGVWV